MSILGLLYLVWVGKCSDKLTLVMGLLLRHKEIQSGKYSLIRNGIRHKDDHLPYVQGKIHNQSAMIELFALPSNNNNGFFVKTTNPLTLSFV